MQHGSVRTPHTNRRHSFQPKNTRSSQAPSLRFATLDKIFIDNSHLPLWTWVESPCIRDRSNHAETQTRKKQFGSIIHRAWLHGHEFWSGSRHGQEGRN